MVPPPDESPKSLGDGVTGSDVGRSEPSSPQSIGEGVTSGDFDSELEELGGIDPLDFNEIVDLESRFEIIEVLGQGGMGEVLKAKDRRLGRTVAIKRMLGELAESRQASRRFLTEAKSVAALNHFNIVGIYEMERSADGPYIVMEFVEGGSVGECLKDGAMELAEAVEIIAQVCDGLQKAHDTGIVHRDIKPDNILLTTDGAPKLGDFGLARLATVDGGKTQAGAVLGTLDYMPSEQKEDAGKADAKSDQWSLAATLYQMSTGESPRVIDLDEVPKTIRGVLQQALKSNPELRYESVTAFGQALREAMSGTSQVTVTTDGRPKGQCPSCQAINDLGRKFCNGCGGSLREPCLACEQEIAPWESFCPECGGNLEELANTRSKELDKKKKKIDGLRRECRWADALNAAAELGEQQQARLRDYSEWSNQAAEEIKAEKKQREQERDEAVLKARKLFDEERLEEAVRVIEQVPGRLKNKSLDRLSKQIEQRNADLAARVKAMVGDAEEQLKKVEQNHAEGNYPAAIAAAEALASRSEPELAEYVDWTKAELQTLRSELSDWEQKRAKWLVDARSMVDAEEFASAIELLEKLPLTMRSLPGDGSRETATVRKKLERWETALAKQQERERLLERFKPSKQFVRELRSDYRHKEAIEFLEALVHEDIVSGFADDKELATDIKWAREQLSVLREEQVELLDTQSSLLAAARKSLEQYNYAEAVQLLGQNQLPDDLRGVTFRGVHEESQRALEKVRSLRPAISQAVKDKTYDGLLEMVNSYLELNPLDLAVEKLQGQLVRREARQRQRHQEREAAFRRKQERQAETQKLLRARKMAERQKAAVQADEERLRVIRKRRFRIKLALCLIVAVIVGNEAWTWYWQWEAESRNAANRLLLQKLAAEEAEQSLRVMESVRTLAGHSDRVNSVSFSSDGNWIVSGSHDTMVKVWDAQTGEEMDTLEGHSGYVMSVCFSPDGKRIVSGSRDGTVRVWNSQTGKETLTLKGHSSDVFSVSFSPDGKRIASGCGTVWSSSNWDAETDTELVKLGGNYSHSGYGKNRGVIFSPDGKQIVTCGKYYFKVWDAETEKELRSVYIGDWVHSVGYSPDGKRIVSDTGDETVKVWDAQTGKETLTLKGHSKYVISVSFSPDGKWIVSGSGDNTVKVWDAQTGEETLTLKGHSDDVRSVSFSPDGKRIVSGSDDNTLKVWDLSSLDTSE